MNGDFAGGVECLALLLGRGLLPGSRNTEKRTQRGVSQVASHSNLLEAARQRFVRSTASDSSLCPVYGGVRLNRLGKCSTDRRRAPGHFKRRLVRITGCCGQCRVVPRAGGSRSPPRAVTP